MNNIIYSFIICLFAGLSTLLGLLFIFIKISNTNKFLSISLSFSASIMILISIFDLIPLSFFNIIHKYKLLGFILIIIFFICGMLVINMSNIIINKLEEKGSSLYKLGLLSSFVLILHNIPEGIITFLSSTSNVSLGIKISIAIALHNIPEGICIAVPIYYSTKSLKKAFFTTFISGMSELFGAILSYLFLYKYISINTLNFIFIFVSGIMLSLSINNIYSESIKYSEYNKKYIIVGTVIGVIFFIISIIFNI